MECIQVVSEILSVLKSTNEHQKVLSLLIDRLMRLYHCQTAAVIIIDPKTEYLSIENSEGLSHTFCKAFRTKIATGAIGRLLWTGVPLFISRAEENPSLAEEVRLEYVFASAVCVQIAVDGRTIGYLHVDSKEPDAFSTADGRMLQSIADFAGLAMVKAHLHEENMRLNPYDNETGLLKYHTFFDKFEEVLERASASEEPFGLLLMDVDNYKEIARLNGHDTAKMVLREIADIVRGSLRPIDFGGRYGFDEFIVLLENSDAHGAVAEAKRIAKKIHDAKMTPEKIQTSVSIGVGVYPGDGSTQTELLLAAKEALFDAQRSGRNKVLSHHVPQKGVV
ncbi:MAG: sensor domain-containing diguanylate cyclase [Ignavibacteriales bacterium]|nr:sensor domain-containing diguanylate cyclase [Ignavibacteriales bacterium]